MTVKGVVFVTVLFAPAMLAADAPEESRSKAEIFAIEILNPSIEFVWYSRSLREKLVARLGIPDKMKLTTMSDRMSPAHFACDTWNYELGPELEVCGGNYEWIESFSLPVNTQIPLPLGLLVGYSRKRFLDTLEIDDKGKTLGDPILLQTEYHGSGGSTNIDVRIEFDEKGNSTRITWSSIEY